MTTILLLAIGAAIPADGGPKAHEKGALARRTDTHVR